MSELVERLRNIDGNKAALLQEAAGRIEELESRELGYIQSLRELEARVRELDWISVEDRLPEPGKNVLVCKGTDTIFVAHLSSQRWYPYLSTLHVTEITNWMPFPSPPEEA